MWPCICQHMRYLAVTYILNIESVFKKPMFMTIYEGVERSREWSMEAEGVGTGSKGGGSREKMGASRDIMGWEQRDNGMGEGSRGELCRRKEKESEQEIGEDGRQIEQCEGFGAEEMGLGSRWDEIREQRG